MWATLFSTAMLLACAVGAAEPKVPSFSDEVSHCAACLHFVNRLHKTLLPQLELEDAARREAEAAGQRYKRSGRMGAVDDLVDEMVSGGCNSLEIHSDVVMRTSCEHLVEEYGDELQSALVKWHRAKMEVSALRGTLCARAARACRTNQLNLVPHPNAPGKTSFRSQRPPAVNDGPVFKAVSATFIDTVKNVTVRDVLIYFYRENDHEGQPDERHAQLWPTFERLAQLMHAMPRPPGTFMFVKIDIAANEMAPPFDFLEKPTMVLMLAGSATAEGIERLKMPNMKSLDWVSPLTLPLNDILVQLAAEPTGFGSVQSRQHAYDLGLVLGEDRLHRDNWWADEEILARVKNYMPDEERDEL
jgi:hypothetical protein